MINLLSELNVVTERLCIRHLEESDLKEIYSIHSDPDVNQYIPYDTWLNWSDAEDWFATIQQRREDNDAEQFVIETLKDRKLVGTCIVFAYDCEGQAAELGYVLARQAWKKGFMLEAMLSFVPALQKRLTLTSLHANVETKNIASLALLEKLNFKKIGTKVDDDNITLVQLTKTFQD